MNESITDWFRIVWSLLSGAFMTALGFLMPVKNIVHLLILFFLLDVVFGYWAARKLRKEKFSAKIIWKTTFPRMVISLVLVICAFLWDNVYQQTTFSTYNLIGWFISGVLLASIAINGYYITRWDIFLGLGKFFRDKTKDLTGIEIVNNENHECNN